MSFKKTVVYLSSIGFALGIVICLVITSAIATMEASDGTVHLCAQEFENFVGGRLEAVLIQLLVTGIYGAVAFGGSAVYRIEEWSMLKATVAHFLMTVASYYLAGFFLRWFSISDISWCLLWLVIFIIVYTTIWLTHYFSYRAQIKRINEELLSLKDLGQLI